MSTYFRVLARNRLGSSSVLAIFLVLSTAWNAAAAVPTATYQKWQSAAPEAVTLEVVKVKTESTKEAGATRTAVVITAKVCSVERSRSRLEKGTLITIVYTNLVDDRPIPGERPVALLRPGKIYSAFLRQADDGRAYLLAASAGSFAAVAETPERPHTGSAIP
jgi:hypothetical protein